MVTEGPITLHFNSNPASSPYYDKNEWLQILIEEIYVFTSYDLINSSNWQSIEITVHGIEDTRARHEIDLTDGMEAVYVRFGGATPGAPDTTTYTHTANLLGVSGPSFVDLFITVPTPNQVEGIVVTPNSTMQNTLVGQLIHFHGQGSATTGGGILGGIVVPDCREMQIEFDAAATAAPDAGDQASEFSKAIESQSDRVRALPDGLEVNSSLVGGAFTNGVELKQLWSLTDWIVTGITPAPGYGGSANANGGNPINTVYNGYLDNYLVTDARQVWYFFHELAHSTANGQALHAMAYADWQANSPGVAWENSTQFAGNEQFMNSVAASLAALFGYDLRSEFPNVGHGYLPEGDVDVLNSPSSLTPDTANAGPGGNC
ncbi:hypothetical protein SGCZBJ_21405 [Caulobacter zeae]|uniref:Uncharacterized protein n=1 Tax=Caulobacter zeae TaxID=2055137 RepID=A0A2N5D4K6_9CAUL|nr:hypothetical protein SGCZBJ_21405 [Caulobacter zeae]